MTTELVLPFVFQGGGLMVVAWVFGLLHRSAVRAHDQRAADWREVARLATARSEELDRQLWTLVSAVKDSAGAA